MSVSRINITAIPNQTFPLIVNNNSLEVHIKTMRGDTFLSLKSNDRQIIQNVKCFSNQWVIPYNTFNLDYNFMWLSDYETPYYERFGSLDFLMLAARG